MQTKNELDLTADVIDVRDIIARVEELEPQVDAIGEGEHIAEWNMLTRILHELKGYGGDEQWRGDWYPITLIGEHYFTEYAQDLLADCGELPRDLPHYIEIDWQATARNIRIDYSPVDIDGVTYWYR
jgi:hypothetical protein